MRLWKGRVALACGLISLLTAAAPANAAVGLYPHGGSDFEGSVEGWQVTAANCNVSAFCSARGGYDGEHGNPGGSISAETDITLNLLSQFTSEVSFQSPDFEVSAGGAATLHLERQFETGSLVDLAPRLDYSVQLVDRTSDKRSTAISEAVESGSGWSGEGGAATVQAGHAYAIAITARTSSTVAGTGLLAGTTAARFDNVALTVGSAAAGGRNGENGDGSTRNGSASNPGAGPGAITDTRLSTLAAATVAGPAKLRGRRLYVKARCPKSIGRACRVTLVGLVSKRRPATAKRTTKVARGKKKRLALKVKPRARRRVAGRKRLLFKLHVRAGRAQATVYRRLRLIRR